MNGPEHERPPAIIVGAGLNGLGLIRSLTRERIPCHLVVPPTDDPTAKTRLAHVFYAESIHDHKLVPELVRLAKGLDCRPVLFLTQEAVVRIAAEHREELKQHFALNIPPRATIEKLTSKSGFQESADAFGSPIPKTKTASNLGEIAEIREFQFPVIFKPNTHSEAYSSNFRKAYKLTNFEEVAELYSRVQEIEKTVIIQEWIDGEDSDIYFCLQYRGESAKSSISFCGRKLQSHPPGTGGTASCTIAPKSLWQEIVALTDDYFAKAQVTGMCSMEFKRDRNTKKLIMIEPTIARSDYQEEVATWHGYNIPATAYHHLAGGTPLPPKPSKKTHIWRDAEALRHYPSQNRRGLLLTSLQAGALFSWRDPIPWLSSIKAKVLKKL